MWLHALWLGQIMCTLHDFMQGGHTLSYIVGSLSGCGIYMWSKNSIGMDAWSKFWFSRLIKWLGYCYGIMLWHGLHYVYMMSCNN